MAWGDLVGQERAMGLLRAHLAEGRAANGYLLAGPEGVGKGRLAMEFAKAVNCQAAGEHPCDTCAACVQMSRGAHPDLHVLQPSGASRQIGIEEVRRVLARVALRPYSAAVQVVVIEEAERLTAEAGNALLKSLEEPGPATRYVLTTAAVAQCLPTIVSRCQLIRCPALAQDAIRRILEARGVPGPTAARAAGVAGGSAARALALAERWGGYEAMTAQLAAATPARWLQQPLPESRAEVAEWLTEMVLWLRDVAVMGSGGAAPAHAFQAEALAAQGRRVEPARCAEVASELMALRDSLETFVNPRLVAALAREKYLSLMANGE